MNETIIKQIPVIREIQSTDFFSSTILTPPLIIVIFYIPRFKEYNSLNIKKIIKNDFVAG